MTRQPTLCGLCGAHGHLAADCPWQSVRSRTHPAHLRYALARGRYAGSAAA
jgi:hypothetical protein